MNLAIFLAAAVSISTAAEPDPLQPLYDRYAEISTLDASITQTQTTATNADRPASSITQTWLYDLRFDREASLLTINSSWGSLASNSDEFLITCFECETYETLPANPLSIASLAREEHIRTEYILNIPILDMLLGDREHIYSHTNGLKPTGKTRTQTVDGKTYNIIETSKPYTNNPSEMLDTGPDLTSPAEYWIDTDTGLLKRVVIDFLDADRIYKEQTYGEEYTNSRRHIDSYIATFEIEYHSIDEPIDPALFQTSTEGLEFAEAGPPQDSENFSSFDGVNFIHKPVPQITATTITGEKISTDDLKGKVLIIDFWATWCPPCVAAMPILQDLADEYADRGLVVIGINQDDADSREAVDEFLENKNITFPQIIDSSDLIGARFGVRAIPTTLIIDAEGIVQAYAVGFHSKADYAEQIEKILNGETLPKPEAPPAPSDTVDIIENLNLNLFVWPAPVTAWEGSTIKLDSGDAFIMPHDAGGLAKLDHATGQLTRISLPGYEQDHTTLAFAPVNDKHGGWIFATDTSMGYGDIAFTRITENGTRRWSVPLGIDPDIEPMYDAGIEAYDIDNDGQDEFFIAVSVTDSTNFETEVFLVVLENNGKAIYTKPLPLEYFGATHLVEVEGEPPALYIFGMSKFVRITLDF